MNTTNIFYPHSFDILVHKYFAYEKKFGLRIRFFLLLLFPFCLMLPIWYVMDIIASILDWLCMKIFVELPLHSYQEMERMEKMGYYRSGFFFLRKGGQ